MFIRPERSPRPFRSYKKKLKTKRNVRYFNTSGPNNPQEHYTLMREKIMQKGMDLVEKSRYFTIWAPRQTGKSTYFLLLAEELKKIGYKVCWINFEDYQDEPLEFFFRIFSV